MEAPPEVKPAPWRLVLVTFAFFIAGARLFDWEHRGSTEEIAAEVTTLKAAVSKLPSGTGPGRAQQLQMVTGGIGRLVELTGQEEDAGWTLTQWGLAVLLGLVATNLALVAFLTIRGRPVPAFLHEVHSAAATGLLGAAASNWFG